MLSMVVKKDSLPSLPLGVQRYIKEYFVHGSVFCSEVYHAFLDHYFPVTKDIVRGRAPISSDAVDNLPSEGLQETKLTGRILNQQEHPYVSIVLFKL